MLVATGAAPVTRLDVEITGLRSAKGLLRVCLTAVPANFPECGDEGKGAVRNVPAGVRVLHFDGLPRGNYAIAVIHDENSNHRLDTIVRIPREGFGFSRDPHLGFGPPKFAAAAFPVAGDAERQQVRIHYWL